MKNFGIIRDTVFPRLQDASTYYTRLTSRAILVKRINHEWHLGLLVIKSTDVFGVRDHFETPGGGIEGSETKEEALRREIEEETGHQIKTIIPIGEIGVEYNPVTRIDQSSFFLAITSNTNITHPTEDVPLFWVPFRQVRTLYNNHNTKGVGILIHERDLLMYKEVEKILEPLFRIAIMNDYPDIMDVVKDAKAFLKSQGSKQWQQDYPNEAIIKKDIDEEKLYVLERLGEIIGIATIDDYDENYEEIDGEWLNDEEYLVVHRIALKTKAHGFGYAQNMLNKIVTIAKEKAICNIRMDTSFENIPMKRLMENMNFKDCGVILLKSQMSDDMLKHINLDNIDQMNKDELDIYLRRAYQLKLRGN